MENPKTRTFDEWLMDCDAAFAGLTGVSLHGVEDMPWRAWFDDGYTPGDAAEEAAEEAGFDGRYE